MDVRPAQAPLLALTVGVVLADSAVVTLALPEILQRLHGTVSQVAWVLLAFNLVLAVVVVPAAITGRHWNPAILCAAGIVIFAAASAACAGAGSLGVLITARSIQALGGAFVLVGCLQLLIDQLGERRGTTWWIVAGVFGTAAGPVAGGLLTDAFSWRSIFIVQVPIAILAVPAALSQRRRIRPVSTDEPHRPSVAPNLALVLLSAALTAVLFLLVLLLVDGWRRSPATAAVTVSVVPLAALLARPLARLTRAVPAAETMAGCLLIAGGLVGLALLPSASLGWTIGPQALVGLGLGLTLDRLTLQAMRDRVPTALHGGWTIAARHAGVVLGLAILTPVFAADLSSAQTPAQDAITALVLDAPLKATDKIALAQALSDQLHDQQGRIPDLHSAFTRLQLPTDERAAGAKLERDLDDQLQRAATHAFRNAFLVGAGLAVAALLSLIPLRRRGAR